MHVLPLVSLFSKLLGLKIYTFRKAKVMYTLIWTALLSRKASSLWFWHTSVQNIYKKYISLFKLQTDPFGRQC